ncbi:GNAT family N-acetyltransferase [Micromonospora sp. DT43]|uniref:GNAT family N-acetyltransferase n=1 Tax=Micromonospora sp. DT43 TaxID=3393440 RepID=UPI003CEFC689
MLESTMHAEYDLRSVTEDEFAAWARMIGDTYGADRSEEELANQRAATDLSRTVAAFDGDIPVAGASVYRRLLTVPGAVVPVAGIASVAVTPSHRRRGLLTAMMRVLLTEQYEKGGEPVAVLRPSEAAIYGRYGIIRRALSRGSETGKKGKTKGPPMRRPPPGCPRVVRQGRPVRGQPSPQGLVAITRP